MRRNNKKHKVIAFLFAIILIGLGYAYLTANLKITGTTKIGDARFDVHFENASLNSASSNITFPSNSNSNLAQGIPIIKGENNTELEWHVILNQPGDYYIGKAVVVNLGDIDAVLDFDNSIIKVKIGDSEEVTSTFKDIKVEYAEGLGFQYLSNNFITGIELDNGYRTNREYLNAGDTIDLYIISGINEKNITNEQWESIRGKDITITVDLKYIQGDNNPPSSNSNSHSNGNSNRELDIRYENPTFISAGTTTEFPNNINVPTLTNTVIDEDKSGHTIEFNTVFNNPGDYYEFSVDFFNETNPTASIAVKYRKNELSIDNGELVDLGSLYSNFNEFDDMLEIKISAVIDNEKEDNGYEYTIVYNIKVKDDITQEKLDLIKGKNLYFKLYEILEAAEHLQEM